MILKMMMIIIVHLLSSQITVILFTAFIFQ